MKKIFDSPPLVTGPWTLADYKSGLLGTPRHNLSVFSCFHCGGGSSMGYKLAGFNVLGGVEIDPDMMAIYRANHNPDHSFLMGVQDFKVLTDIPTELFDLDVLDGSPPCSSFSVAGNREKDWSSKKKFREGQTEQVLDDLFFHFIDIASKLKPKIVVAENVKGLVQGYARGYVKEIFQAYKKAGYSTQLFLLNSATMGVPQQRERTFFISTRDDLGLGKLSFDFQESSITVRQAIGDLKDQKGQPLSAAFKDAWKWCSKMINHRVEDYFEPRKFWHHQLAILDRIAVTQTASIRLICQDRPERLSDLECIRIQTFPDDYNFLKTDAGYVCGMSVPPLMMQRIASQIAKTLFQYYFDVRPDLSH